MCRTFLSSSEFVSPSHPDRVADDLAAKVIDDIQHKDGVSSHAAIEVFLTRDTVIFSGEAVTSLQITDDYLREVVRYVFDKCGYIPEMRRFWIKDEVVLADDIQIENRIVPQSPDIALGTTDKAEESGWNDQGIYFSSADNSNDKLLGYPMYVATLIGENLHALSRQTIKYSDEYPVVLGPDIKVVVTCEVKEDGFTPIQVTALTIAVAHASVSNIGVVREVVKGFVSYILFENSISVSDDCQWVINGTGRFVVMGSVSDTSMTGRKISVNHPSAGPLWCNKMIGGGSLVKPWHASDLILNIASRYVANHIVRSGLSSYAVVGCAGAIGQKGLQSLFIKGDEYFDEVYGVPVTEYFKNSLEWTPYALAKRFCFFNEGFDFNQIVHGNFFGNSQPWEVCDKMIIEDLKHYML